MLSWQFTNESASAQANRLEARRKPALRRGLRYAVMGLFDGDASLSAAGVAFYAFLSLFPAIAAGYALFTLVTSPQFLIDSFDRVAPAMPSEIRQMVVDQLAALPTESNAAELSFWVSAGIALWSGSRGINSLLLALTRAGGEEPKRGFLAALWLAVLFTLAAFLLLIVVGAGAAIVPTVLNYLPLGAEREALISALRWPALFLVLVVAHMALFRFGAEHPRRRRHRIWPGAIVASLLWVVGSGALTFYFHNIARYDAVFGSIAGVAIVMFWLYMLTQFTLFGARFNAKA